MLCSLFYSIWLHSRFENHLNVELMEIVTSRQIGLLHKMFSQKVLLTPCLYFYVMFINAKTTYATCVFVHMCKNVCVTCTKSLVLKKGPWAYGVLRYLLRDAMSYAEESISQDEKQTYLLIVRI